MRIVRKDGPNKGKSFYTCAGAADARCNFFQWASDAEAGVGSSTNSGRGSWENNKKRKSSKKNTTNKKQKKNNGESKPRGKRKCGICGIEGIITLKKLLFLLLINIICFQGIREIIVRISKRRTEIVFKYSVQIIFLRIYFVEKIVFGNFILFLRIILFKIKSL